MSRTTRTTLSLRVRCGQFAAIAMLVWLSGCYCYTGEEFVCNLRAVRLGGSDRPVNEFAGCTIANRPISCVGCVPVAENGSFEYGLDRWSGDSVRVVTRQERLTVQTPPDPILPCSFAAMAQVMFTTPTGPGTDVAADIQQVIDLTGIPRPDPGIVVANLLVNRVATAFSDGQFGIRIENYQGDPVTFPAGATLLETHEEIVFSDDVVDAWEWVSTSTALRPDADFLVVTLRALENARNEEQGTEFLGHYLDGLHVEIGMEGAYDLQLAHRTTSSVARTGEEVRFELELTHVGLDPVPGVAVDVPWGADFAYVSHTGDGTYDPTTGRWDLGMVPVNGRARLSLRAQVTATPPQGGRVDHTATIVSGLARDIESGNDAATASVQVLPYVAYDLALNQEMTPLPVVQGDSAVITLTLSNLGPRDLNSFVQIDNVLPVYLFPQRYETDLGTYDAERDQWWIHRVDGTLPAGGTATLRVTAIAGLPGIWYEPAVITRGLGRDDDPANNADSVRVEITPSSDPYEIEVRVEAETPYANEGDLIGYRIHATNRGSSAATGVIIEVVPPSGLTYAAHLLGHGSFDPATNAWGMGYLLPGQSVTLTTRYVDALAGQHDLSAFIAAGNDDDPNPGNDVDNASLTVIRAQRYNLAVTVADGQEPSVVAGDTIEVPVTVTNDGPGLSRPPTVRLTIPSELELIETTGDGTYHALVDQWSMHRLQAGESATRMLRVRVGTGLLASLEAEIVAGLHHSELEGDNDDFVLFHLQDRPILITPIPDRILGAGASESIAMTNHFSDAFSLDFTASSSNPAVVTATVDGFGTIFLTALAAGTADVTVTATNFDGFSTVDTFRVTVSAVAADLAVTVSASNPLVTHGAQVALGAHVVRTPIGVAFPGVQVEFPIPPGLTYLSHSTPSGTYDPATGVWAFDLASASQLDFLVVQVQADVVGSHPVTATLVGGASADTDPSNNTATTQVSVQVRYDLQLNLTAFPTTLAVGQQSTIDVVLANAGPNPAPGAEVTYQLPAGLSYVSHTGDGTYDPASGIWTLGAMPVGPASFLRIFAEGATAGTYAPTATLTGGATADINPANNSGMVTFTVQ